MLKARKQARFDEADPQTGCFAAVSLGVSGLKTAAFAMAGRSGLDREMSFQKQSPTDENNVKA